MNDCFYCENGEKLNSLMIEVCKLDYSTAVSYTHLTLPTICSV